MGLLHLEGQKQPRLTIVSIFRANKNGRASGDRLISLWDIYCPSDLFAVHSYDID